MSEGLPGGPFFQRRDDALERCRELHFTTLMKRKNFII